MPSRDYTGPHEATIRGNSKPLIHPNKKFRDLSTAVWKFWMQYLSPSLMPETVRGTEFLTEAEHGKPAFRAGEVYRAKKVLKHLAVMPIIDKCQHRMLIE